PYGEALASAPPAPPPLVPGAPPDAEDAELPGPPTSTYSECSPLGTLMSAVTVAAAPPPPPAFAPPPPPAPTATTCSIVTPAGTLNTSSPVAVKEHVPGAKNDPSVPHVLARAMRGRIPPATPARRSPA